MPQGDLRAAAKRIAAGGRKKPNPTARQVSRCARGADALSPSPSWRLRRSARLGRFFEMPSFVNRNAPAISHPPLLPETPYDAKVSALPVNRKLTRSAEETPPNRGSRPVKMLALP